MSSRPPLLPMVLLAALSVLTLAGPFGIFVVLRGGANPEWPPDRPVEWWVFSLVCGVYATLMVVCVWVAAINLRRMRRSSPGPRPGVDASPSGGPPPA